MPPGVLDLAAGRVLRIQAQRGDVTAIVYNIHNPGQSESLNVISEEQI